jgi:hypothetical protein
MATRVDVAGSAVAPFTAFVFGSRTTSGRPGSLRAPTVVSELTGVRLRRRHAGPELDPDLP